ncbi:hypothetical protein [Microbacterium sp. PF5]|uniref:hypothetical protein n=2 Tax=unclassified Microbacterium TaxID=2609290 RepID=UPI00109BD34C|nr:hypothetical protein [Microbacterium sp. PF5]
MAHTPTVDADRHRGARVALGAGVVVVAFLVAGTPAALGAFAVVVGFGAVRRARRRPERLPRLTFTFAVVDVGGDGAPCLLLSLPPDADETVAEVLRAHGWSTLEPPVNGPVAPVRRVGVEFRGDDGLRLRDLGVPGPAYAEAMRRGAVPGGWGAAAERTGWVLLLAVPEQAWPLDPDRTVRSPVLGAYGLLHGSRAGGSPAGSVRR